MRRLTQGDALVKGQVDEPRVETWSATVRARVEQDRVVVMRAEQHCNELMKLTATSLAQEACPYVTSKPGAAYVDPARGLVLGRPT